MSFFFNFFLICFGVIFIAFLLTNSFVEIKACIIIIQTLFSIILFLLLQILVFSNNIQNININTIHNLNFYPIINISVSNSTESDLLNFEFINIGKYSQIKEREFTKECLTNFFINKSFECPITDIILEDNRSFLHEGYTEIKLPNEEYLYFTNKNKSGRLYKNEDIYYALKYNNFTIKNNFNYSSEYFIRSKTKEDLKLYKLYYYYYEKVAYFLVNVLYIFLCFYYFAESPNPRLFDYFKIINYILDIIILIIYSIGLILFKKYSSNGNGEFIENIFISIQLVKIIFIVLYIIFPKKWQITHYFDYKGEDWEGKYRFFKDDDERNFRIFYLFLPLFVVYFLVVILDLINDLKINKKLDGLLYNWKTSPIYSIEISPIKDYEIGKIITKEEEFKFYSWKNSYFKIKRLNGLNYVNIYKKENGKLCGKDSEGNNLYFPEDIECPINDIIISKNSSFEGYNKLTLGDNNTYLYYTNKNVEKKIIIDIRANYFENYFYNVWLNLNKSNDLCHCLENSFDICKDYYAINLGTFFERIDYWDMSLFFVKSNISTKSYGLVLNTFTYLGINKYNIEEKGKTSNFEKNMKYFQNNITFKFHYIYINVLIFIIINIFLLINNNNKIQFIISIIFLIMKFGNLLLYSISLNIKINYIKNYMDKINNNFYENRNDYQFSIYIFIYEIIIFFSLLFIIIYIFWFKDSKREIQRNNREVIINNNSPIIVQNPIEEQQVEQNTTESINDLIGNNNSNLNNNLITQENNIIDSKHNCIYCLDNPTKIILYPCRHRICCENCYERLKVTSNNIKICPVCRRTVVDVIDKVYDI